jgi:hypothetical protein
MLLGSEISFRSFLQIEYEILQVPVLILLGSVDANF